MHVMPRARKAAQQGSLLLWWAHREGRPRLCQLHQYDSIGMFCHCPKAFLCTRTRDKPFIIGAIITALMMTRRSLAAPQTRFMQALHAGIVLGSPANAGKHVTKEENQPSKSPKPALPSPACGSCLHHVCILKVGLPCSMPARWTCILR